MKTIEVKTSELGGAALDWAVAKAIKWIEPLFGIGAIRYLEADRYLMMETPDPDEPEDVTKPSHFNHYVQWSPSRIWSQGGTLIDKYGKTMGLELRIAENSASFLQSGMRIGYTASDVLIAACRAIVAAKLGDTVRVPADLMGATA